MIKRLACYVKWLCYVKMNWKIWEFIAASFRPGLELEKKKYQYGPINEGFSCFSLHPIPFSFPVMLPLSSPFPSPTVLPPSPPNQLVGLGECCKFPQRDPWRSVQAGQRRCRYTMPAQFKQWFRLTSYSPTFTVFSLLAVLMLVQCATVDLTYIAGFSDSLYSCGINMEWVSSLPVSMPLGSLGAKLGGLRRVLCIC